MSNLDAVSALVTAINFDRFDEIQAAHASGVAFRSFRGPTLRDNVSVRDWHHQFLERYADCSYTETEAIEAGDDVALRATIEAKGYDWRAFQQRALEVFTFEDGLITARRMYGMLRDIELDKPANAALDAAAEFRGGSPGDTKKLLEGFYAALLAGDTDGATEALDERVALIDSVYGITSGPANVLELFGELPTPAFGYQRVTNIVAGDKHGAVEIAIEPSRPRAADWVRIVEGKIIAIERYWMLREIGVDPFVEYSRDRHRRQVILPR